MRRAACGLQTRGYWSIFARLAYELAAEAPRDCLEMGMATLPPTYRFPNDAEFGDALRDTDLHGRYFCKQLLDGLETLGHKEKADTSSLTIVRHEGAEGRPRWPPSCSHAARGMRVGPSEPPGRGRLQTAVRCFGQEPGW